MSEAVDPSLGPDAVVVYWRGGCGFCMRLLRTLERAGVRTELRNIWEDDDARRFVAAHNRGSETVPTVEVGDRVVTNPNPDELLAWLAETHPHLVAEREEQPRLFMR
ncbi:MAG: NrdH-redoxin [Actinomycetota bacterium]|nr:NrdH-redoxin [Actinomycetota bacterium]